MAISAIETSYNDLNSETFFELAVASHSAEDYCQATFKGCHHCPLDFMNNALKGLCEICVVVSKLFAGIIISRSEYISLLLLLHALL